MTYDGWSRGFIRLMNSDFNSHILFIIFVLPLIFSVVIHGLVIANFYITINKVKNTEVEFLDPRQVLTETSDFMRMFESPCTPCLATKYISLAGSGSKASLGVQGSIALATSCSPVTAPFLTQLTTTKTGSPKYSFD